MSRKPSIPMDTQTGRDQVPAASDRLHGADRGNLGEEGWAEVPEDLVGHPDDTNVPPEFYEPASATDPPDQPL
ncbi:MAG TPA: hypothetical protein VEF55_07360 [Candidatus Binatia bacterium]|nr:hypothetical protein [Candidatus Binatia bacterium]